jgi:hypothetical protein
VDVEQTIYVERLALWERRRVSAQAQVDDMVKQLRIQLSEMENTGNRHLRRKVKIARKRIAAFERWHHERLDTLFQKITGGFDIEAGTLRAVQEEASAKLAAIFN